ncbi:MAG: helix-turn-helix domain-containing protein [Oscillospiraceae bacterium]
MDELKLIFASNLIRLRTAAGMTQAELGEQLNYSDKSISKWERGEAIPDAMVLKRMSELFGVTVDYLLNEHDAWQPRPEPSACDRSHHCHHPGRPHGHRHAGGAGVRGAVAVARPGGVGRVSLLRAGGGHYLPRAQQRVFRRAGQFVCGAWSCGEHLPRRRTSCCCASG